MNWEAVQLKYQLLRIVEMVESWAKFTKSKHLSDLVEWHTSLRVDKLDLNELMNIQEEVKQIIIQSNDTRLYNDLKSFVSLDIQNNEKLNKGHSTA